MITRVTEREKLQIKCHMYYNVSLVQPGDREEKGKFRGDKKEEKDGRQQSRRDKIQILSRSSASSLLHNINLSSFWPSLGSSGCHS